MGAVPGWPCLPGHRASAASACGTSLSQPGGATCRGRGLPSAQALSPGPDPRLSCEPRVTLVTPRVCVATGRCLAPGRPPPICRVVRAHGATAGGAHGPGLPTPPVPVWAPLASPRQSARPPPPCVPSAQRSTQRPVRLRWKRPRC